MSEISFQRPEFLGSSRHEGGNDGGPATLYDRQIDAAQSIDSSSDYVVSSGKLEIETPSNDNYSEELTTHFDKLAEQEVKRKLDEITMEDNGDQSYGNRGREPRAKHPSKNKGIFSKLFGW